ncbi:MAG TPA: YciI family protein [Candidatus Limnocylindrales bacterium]
MKYLIMIYSNPENWDHPVFMQTGEALAMPQSERDEMMRDDEALMTEIYESGELLAAAALDEPRTSRTVRVRDRAALATDGPYAESKEHLAGFFIVECDTAERAEQIAARFPDARFGAVEVRPIMGAQGMGVA